MTLSWSTKGGTLIYLQVTVCTFATYLLSSPDHILDANKIFVSMALFNILQVPLNAIPSTFAYAAQVPNKGFSKNHCHQFQYVWSLCNHNFFRALFLSGGLRISWGVKKLIRIMFLTMCRTVLSFAWVLFFILPQYTCWLMSMLFSPDVVTIKSGKFTWGRGSMPALTKWDTCFPWVRHQPPNILIRFPKLNLYSVNLTIEGGKLVGITGQVGCGKSSLISAILGEMEVLDGVVNQKVRKYFHTLIQFMHVVVHHDTAVPPGICCLRAPTTMDSRRNSKREHYFQQSIVKAFLWQSHWCLCLAFRFGKLIRRWPSWNWCPGKYWESMWYPCQVSRTDHTCNVQSISEVISEIIVCSDSESSQVRVCKFIAL